MIEVQTFPLGPLQTNCHVLYRQGSALVIDPGGDPSSVVSFLQKNNLQLEYILNTHFHVDHILGNKPLQDATGATILASSKDDFLLGTEVGKGGRMVGLPEVEPFEYENIDPGEHELIGEMCQVLATPGHSSGSLSFYFPHSGKLFSGDLLFFQSIGRTDFPGGSTETLLASVREKIFTLPEETVVYSGHGPETTVRDEKKSNPFFQSRYYI